MATVDQEPLLSFLITWYVQVEMVGLGDYLMVMEEMCLRAGELRKHLEKDRKIILIYHYC